METQHTAVEADAKEVVVELPHIRTILEKMWQSITNMLPYLWIATAVLYVLQLPVVFYSTDLSSGFDEAVELVVLLVVNAASGLFAVALVYYIVQLYIDPTTATLEASLRWLGRHLFTVLVLMALAFGITLTGVFLLLIPALVFAVYNMFSYIVLVREEKRSPVNYIIRSTELVYGAFWPLLGRVVAVLVIAWIVLSIAGWFASLLAAMLLGFLPSPLLELVVLGVTVLVQVLGTVATVSVLLQLYDVRYTQTVDQPSQLPAKRLRIIYRTAAIIGWLGFLSLTLGLFVMFMASFATGW